MKEAAATLDGELSRATPSDAQPRSVPRVVIQPSRGIHWIDIAELWESRALVASLTIRHIRVRYAQSVLGVGWAVVQPLTSMIVFSVIFGKFARLSSDGSPYQAVLARLARPVDVFFNCADRRQHGPEQQLGDAH